MKDFSYDSIIALDSTEETLKFLKYYNNSQALSDKKPLGLIYDLRLYKLNEKNYIKSLIEEFPLDCLKFTLRPSASLGISNIEGIERFKCLSALSFLMQSMVRYEIDMAYVSSNHIYLKPNDSGEIIAEDLFNHLIEWMTSLDINIMERNDLCSINYLKNFKGKFKNKKICLVEYLIDEKDELIELDYNFEEQISPLEKDLFWIGFDPKYKDVPWNKEYKETKWTKELRKIKPGEGYYENDIKYCNRCCIPETMEGITFDDLGICTPCISSEEKMHINWQERQESLKEIFRTHEKSDYYDCLLPLSGGKDSTFQAHCLVKQFKVNPLAVTHGQNWYSLAGRYNLENCISKFDLDHLFFVASRKVIDKAARKSIDAIGDACWHCHAGVGSFVIQTAVKWDVGLMIWGESIAERDGRGSYVDKKEASPFYFVDTSSLIRAEDYDDQNISSSELSQWFYPTESEIEKKGIRFLHLGDFMFWDEEKQVEYIIEEYEWMNASREGTYKGYKSNECVMAGVHDYLNFMKRGTGRATFEASDDIRRGLITRQEGVELAKKHDSQRPHALDYYIEITDITENEIEKKILDARKLSSYASLLNTTKTKS